MINQSMKICDKANRKIIWTSVAFAAALLTAPTLTLAQSETGQPQYNSNGDLKIPQGYETWVFVGSNLGLGYKKSLAAMTSVEAKRVETGSFHNIYIAPGAYRQFINKGTFPDKTVLVMEHYVAQDKEPQGIVTEGVFNGQRSGFEVAVKNSNRPDGSKTPWAYYIFTDKNDPAKVIPVASAFKDSACNQCHVEHASTDNVWVQFYPVLRKHQK